MYIQRQNSNFLNIRPEVTCNRLWLISVILHHDIVMALATLTSASSPGLGIKVTLLNIHVQLVSLHVEALMLALSLLFVYFSEVTTKTACMLRLV